MQFEANNSFPLIILQTNLASPQIIKLLIFKTKFTVHIKLSIIAN